MEYTFHLGFVTFQSTDSESTNNNDDASQQSQAVATTQQQPTQSSSSGTDVPKVYTKLLRLIEFDTFVATHGPGTDVDGKKLGLKFTLRVCTSI